MDLLHLSWAIPQFGRSIWNVTRPRRALAAASAMSGCKCGGCSCDQPSKGSREGGGGNVREPGDRGYGGDVTVEKYYCCCVKKMTVTALGPKEKVVDTGAGKELRTFNEIKVEFEYELQEDEKRAENTYCELEWWEAGSGHGIDEYEPPKDKEGKPDKSKPRFADGKWNASHDRTPDGRKDKKRLEGQTKNAVLNDVDPDSKTSKPKTPLLAGDDEPWGAAGSLDVLLVAKSSCPACLSCCAWLRYSYGGKSIDVEVLGAECSEKCYGIAKDYGDFKPFDSQLKKVGKFISKGEKGGEFSVGTP